MTNSFTPSIELEKNTFNMFDTVAFRKLLIDNNVIITVIGFVIASNTNELINSLYRNIMFVCNEDNQNNENQKKTNNKKCNKNVSIVQLLYNYKLPINIYPLSYYEIYLGRFFISILKFILSCIIAFYLSRFINDILN